LVKPVTLTDLESGSLDVIVVVKFWAFDIAGLPS